MLSKPQSRVFKTARFSKDAKKARISDAELCAAISQVMAGQADDLGGGIFKKRLNDNIEDDELTAFRSLAKAYAGLTDVQIAALVRGKDIVEICHDDKA